MKTICGSHRAGLFRVAGAYRLVPVVLLLGSPAVMWSQDLLSDTPAEPRGLPSGLRVNSVSAWVGRNYLLLPNATGEPSKSDTLAYGAGVDAGLYLPGKTTQASIDYNLNYNGYENYGDLNGFDHYLFLSWKRHLTPSLSLALSGTAESLTVAGYLFQSVAGSTLDLSNAGLLAGSLTPTPAAGATQTILYPGRRKTALGTATLSYAASPRVSWQVSMYGQRLLPTASSPTSGQTAVGYPGATDAGADLSFTYAKSRRTSFGAEVGYYRAVSQSGRTQSGSAGFSVTRVLSKRWFGSALVGYGLGDYSAAGSGTTTLRPDFQGRATLGTSFDAHSLSVSVAQRIGDSYGFGAQRTMEANLSWTWHPKGRKWTFLTNGAYERLTGMQVNKIQSAFIRAALTRQLTTTLSCMAEGVYTWGLQSSSSLGQQSQEGFRFSLVWRPAGTLWHL